MRGMPQWRYPRSPPRHTPVSLAGHDPRPKNPEAHNKMDSYIVSRFRYRAPGPIPVRLGPHCCTCCRWRPCRSECFWCCSCWVLCGAPQVSSSGGCCSACCACGGSEWWQWLPPPEVSRWELRGSPRWFRSCHSLLWLPLSGQNDPLHAAVNLKKYQTPKH